MNISHKTGTEFKYIKLVKVFLFVKSLLHDDNCEKQVP